MTIQNQFTMALDVACSVSLIPAREWDNKERETEVLIRQAPEEKVSEPTQSFTNIDQSILIDLYSIRPQPQAELPVDELFEESDDYDVPSLTSIEDFGEEAKKESNSNTEDISFPDLPDLSEYENMIDWGDNTNSGESSSIKLQFNHAKVYPI